MVDAINISRDLQQVTEKNITNKVKNRENKADFSQTLQSTIKKQNTPSKSNVIDKKLMDVCIEMESLFVNKMFKEMRKTVHKSEWMHGGFAEEIFEDMLYDKYAVTVSKNSNLGLATMLYKDLSKR